MTLQREAKWCGRGAPALAVSLRERFRERRWQKSPVTEESTKDPVKTIAQGMPVDAVYLWLLTRVLFVAHAASGATRIRHSLRPLGFVRVNRCTNSDALRRENIASRLSPLSCPASSGASSTPRPLGLSTAASGILDRPVIPDRVGDRRRATTREGSLKFESATRATTPSPSSRSSERDRTRSGIHTRRTLVLRRSSAAWRLPVESPV